MRKPTPEHRSSLLDPHPGAEPSPHLMALLDAINDVVFMLDIEPDGYRFRYVNASFLHATGLPHEQVVAQRVEDVIPEPSLSLVLTKYQEARDSGAPVRWLETTAYPSGLRYGEVMVTPVADASGRFRHLVGSVHDVTAIHENEDRLRELAYIDSLTGLPNRGRFYMLLHEHIAADPDGALALLYVDLAIHSINDTYGHDQGDDVLRQSAQRVTRLLSDTALVGRLAGDELAVLVTRPSDDQDLAHLANDVLGTLEAPFELPGHQVLITPSIGVSLFPRDTRDAKDLVRFGNAAMHTAKLAGRGTVRFYDDAMAGRARQRINLRAQLQHALRNDQFVLHYQPQVDSRSGRCVGMEALLRWNRPGIGMVLPEGFIDVLEHSNLIVPVGHWVIDTACRQLKQWKDEGLSDIKLSINVSPRQLISNSNVVAPSGGEALGLYARLEHALHTHGIAPGQLELELTETSLMADAERSAVLLQQFRKLGVRVLIDDFGTGYSSLAYLRRLPIDMLKIDREFVRDLYHDDDSEGAAIIDLIVQLAQSLGIGVVAEGVETPDQAAYLRARGCERLQGFHLARPMPAEAATRFLRERPHETV